MAAVAPPPAPAPAAAPGASSSPTDEEIRASSYVGFDSITSQIEHKLLKRGFQFNVIVVGAYYTCVYLYVLCVEHFGMQVKLAWASRR